MVGDGAARGRPVRRRATAGDLRGFGVDVDVPFSGPRPARGTARCRSRTRSAPGCSTRPASPGRASAWARPTWHQLLRDLPGPVGVLAIGDGSARRIGQGARLPRRRGRSFRRRRRRRPAPPATRRAGRARPGRGRAAARRRRAHLAGGRGGACRPRRHRPAALRRRALRRRLPGRRLGRTHDRAPPPVVAVVGPTATGKTALAVALAQRLGGEVVNADSMQLYRGMDIGTAKPDLAERGGVPHHLLDLWHVREPASVAEYRERARAEIDRLRAERRRPAARRRARASTSAPSSTSSTSRAPTPPSGPGSRTSSPPSAPPGCTSGWPRLDPAAAADDPAQQRTPHRARAGGDRADRRPLPRVAARTAAALPGRGRRPRPRAGRARRADRRPGGPHVGGRVRRRGRGAWPPTGCARGPTASRALGYAQVLAQLDGELTAGRGARADGPHHPALRAPPAVVVPPRPGHSPGSTPPAPTCVDAVAAQITARTIER